MMTLLMSPTLVMKIGNAATNIQYVKNCKFIFLESLDLLLKAHAETLNEANAQKGAYISPVIVEETDEYLDFMVSI